MNYKEVIESRYNRQNWQLLLHDIFGNKIKFWNTPSAIPTSSQFAKQALWLGTITLSDNQTVSIYEVELSDSVDIERNRRGIRDMLLTDWRNNGNAGAFMFCYRKNESVLRFSYVSEAWTFADDGSYKKESTDAKRFTYLLGEGHRSRTAIQQFEKLRDSSLTLKDLTKAFSVDAVSDMFFKGYKQQYEDIIFFVTGKRMVKVANKWEERQEGKPNEYIMQQFAKFDNQEKAIRDYVKKLMGRLVFLQFLQKKGWLGVPAGEPWGTGDREFIQNLFAQTADKDHFIDEVLEALFNDLNSENEKKLPQYRTPYLNGGLFERDATDETEFPLPAKYMQSLLDFFASYNFTIDENDPDDAEVGVDPEMLGRIFENLLEDNKDKGAFYTPKEIVSYMCRESLIAYLQTDIEDEATKEAIRQFVTTHDINALGTNDKFRQQVDEALKNVKICDPAIGSGAFPMGLLKELFLCRTALEGIEQNKAAEIKKHIIQQNIYGVDIEKGAVDIARLRFWLSLIVDEETPQALPNLDFKIMQGNSLLEQYHGINLADIMEAGTNDGQLLFVDEDSVNKVIIQEHIRKYFSEVNHEKRNYLRKLISNGVCKLILSNNYKLRDELEAINVMENNQFFLWNTYFADVFDRNNGKRKGFDIVIGNPPYVNVQLMSDCEKQLYRKTYSTFFKRCDMFCLFLELGLLKLASSKGIVTLIIPSVVHSNMSYQKIRDIILNRQWLQEVHYTGGDVFNAPTVDTTILVCNKGGNDHITLTNAVDFAHPKSHRVASDYFSRYNNVVSIGDDQGSEIFDKLFNPKFDIVEQHYNVFQGIVTGNNPAFIFETEQEAKEKNVDVSLLHPLCHGRDIEKYKVRSRERRIIYIDNNIIIDSYPKTKEWLLNFKKTLDTRREVRRGVINWYCLQWPRVKAELDLKDKIILQNTRNEALKTRIVATLDNCGVYGTQGINFIIPKHSEDSLRYLLGILNSKLINYLFATKFLNLAIKAEYVKQIRIPTVNDNLRNQIEGLVNMILQGKQKEVDTSNMETEIDRLVYQLYGLTEEEIKIVEQF